MAARAVAQNGISIALACRTVSISETCYRYVRKLDDENAVIADWLVRLTTNRRSWGIRLVLFVPTQHQRLWLDTVIRQGMSTCLRGHKRVHRIYCELELNLRLKPKMRLKRSKPDTLAVPNAPNHTWSISLATGGLSGH